MTDDPTPYERAALVGDAVLAGIAACDAICGMALGEYARGQDHMQASKMLNRVRLSNPSLVARFTRLLGMKDAAHYSAATISSEKAEQALRIAREMVAEADIMSR